MSDKQLKSNMSSVPIWKKMNLTVEEASEYSGIGTSKIKELSNCEDCPFVLWIPQDQRYHFCMASKCKLNRFL